MTDLQLTSDSAEATREIAARLGSILRAGDVVALFGDLGAGKTCFVQGLAEGLGIAGHVTSPTFILIRHHPGNPPLCHADAYRLTAPQDLEDLGLEDILATGVLAVEWAERVLDALPAERVEVRLAGGDGETREIVVAAQGERLEAALREVFA
jgi:tRNA threonylcarbamoyladenosine biosynthesis protein TsaE